jgi:hypothetical protein
MIMGQAAPTVQIRGQAECGRHCDSSSSNNETTTTTTTTTKTTGVGYTVGYATTNEVTTKECYNEEFLSIKSGC